MYSNQNVTRKMSLILYREIKMLTEMRANMIANKNKDLENNFVAQETKQ